MNIGGKILSIKGDKQLLYRGAKLKNTGWVYGLAIYTGQNTKIMKNSGQAIFKLSQIENKVNYALIGIFLSQLVMCFILAILYGVFRNDHEDSNTYIVWLDVAVAADSVLIFFSYLSLINTMIPISLVVSIEIVKVVQKYFIDSDELMFS